MLSRPSRKSLARITWEILDHAYDEGYTQTSLAGKAGLSRSTVHKLWNGGSRGVRLVTVEQLARAVGFEIIVQAATARYRRRKIA